MKQLKRKLKITRSSDGQRAHGFAEVPGSPDPIAVSRPACPLCGVRAADTKVSIGPVSAEVCRQCSEPMWNAMGLLGWAKKFFK